MKFGAGHKEDQENETEKKPEPGRGVIERKDIKGPDADQAGHDIDRIAFNRFRMLI